MQYDAAVQGVATGWICPLSGLLQTDRMPSKFITRHRIARTNCCKNSFLLYALQNFHWTLVVYIYHIDILCIGLLTISIKFVCHFIEPLSCSMNKITLAICWIAAIYLKFEMVQTNFFRGWNVGPIPRSRGSKALPSIVTSLRGMRNLPTISPLTACGHSTLPTVHPAIAAHAEQQQQPFYGPLSATTRVSLYQKKHSPTHTCFDHQQPFISFLIQ